MNIDNILYTPLDCPEQPEYSLKDINQWTIDNKLENLNLRITASMEGTSAEKNIKNYPWDLKFVYRQFTNKDKGWIGEFNIKFPKLASYFYDAFGLELSDIGLIALLPIKSNHEGIGFWHQDVDNYGLRMYLEFEDMEHNKLLIRRLGVEESIECKVKSNKQCFFLNNVSAEHTTYTVVPNKIRIAVFIMGRYEDQQIWKEKIASLVESSAKMFSDYAIIK